MPPRPIPTFSGFGVFYVWPNPTVVGEGHALATQIGNTAYFKAQLPYIGLYRAKFDQAPVPEIEHILDTVQLLIAQDVNMHKIVEEQRLAYKELSWLVEYARGQTNDPWYVAHVASLGLARYLDKTWLRDKVKRLSARKNPPTKSEMNNIIDYGAYEVRQDFRPRMILARANNTQSFRSFQGMRRQRGTIVEIGFAETGIHDTIANIIGSRA